jgi:beta-xylosidase/sugar lactone lactonase YvrE
MAALALVPLALRADDPPTPMFANVTVHDPSMVRDGSAFYVFGSHMASASTTDLLRWTQITTSAAYPNSLIRNQNPLTEFADALAYAGGATTFWAPDAIKLGDGKYYFYYCACQGSTPLSALGLAKADAVTGPYANVAILLKSSGSTPTVSPYDVNTMPNVVDPSVFFDQTGRLWMVYGSFSGGIFILQLDLTPGSPTIGQPLAGHGYGKKLIGGNSSRIEGPYIIYNPETSYYYLFMTFGGLDAAGGYNVRVGRSPNPDGPYLDAAGYDLTNVRGNYAFDDATIAPYGAKLMGNWQFLHVSGETLSTSRGYVSPGGCSIYRDPSTGKYFLVFHTRFVGSGEVHEVRVHQFYFNADGWPVVAPHRYAGEALKTTDAGRIVGNYKLINHGKDITATVRTSSVITLNVDGSVTGAATGTWLLLGEHDVTLTLSGVTYRGVFARQWDDDNQTWVLTFTALSGNGTAIWGSKVTINTTPAILTQPVSHTVLAGMNVTFSILASGDPAPTYQWQKDGVNIADAIASSYTVPTVTAGNAGSYTVVITNAAGSVVSNTATLTVQTGTGFTVTTLAGQAGASGSADGTGSTARFFSPADVAADGAGNLYVADTYNNSIRKITAAGVVSTVATGFNHPSGIAIDGSGNLYVADTDNNSIRKISTAGTITTLATGFNGLSGIAVDAAANVYVADTLSHTIRKITSAGAVSIVAGAAGVSGRADGTGSAARFYGPQGLTLDPAGYLYVADTNNCTVRWILLSSGAVDTVAGVAGSGGSADGLVTAARFLYPSGVALDSSGNLFVADTDNHTLRLITHSGVVSTIAGIAPTAGSADATGSAARFNYPAGVAVDSSDNVYVADTTNHTVRLAFLATAPSITTQPQSQTVTVGTNVQFAVTASGRPAPTCQWNFNGIPISGATGSSYSLANVQLSNAGDYTVTVSNNSGSVTSGRATLTVNAATSPPPSSGGGGGGGGAMEGWLVAGLALLGAARCTVRKTSPRSIHGTAKALRWDR